MDALDVRILRAMGVFGFGRSARPLATLRAPGIAKRLGVARQRVHERIRRMESSGVIAGYQVTPNHRHLGVESTCYYYGFDDDTAADAAMDKAAPLEGVSGCFGFIGGGVCVNFVYPDPRALQRKLDLLVALAGEGTRLLKFYDLEMPDVDRPLSAVDWRIIASLPPDPWRARTDIADAAGISAKTLKRRLERLAGEGSLFITPKIDPAKVEGILFYANVHLDADAAPGARGRLARAVDEHLLGECYVSSLELGALSLFLFARSVAAAEELCGRLERLAGVEKVTRYFFRAARPGRGWMREAIAAKVAQADG